VGGRHGRQGVIGMMSRRTARAVLPPLFALGLVAFVVRPIDAPVVHAAPVQVTHSTSSSATSSAAAALLAQADSGSGASAQSVSVEVPAVVFTDRAVANAGRLHVPVLLTDPTVSARASVESDPTCGVDLVQGVTGWVDCAVSGRTLLVVHLSDGRSFAQVVRVG
jgi:hypothetical protein